VAGAGVTQLATAGATITVVRALLDEARRKNYHSGVLGIRTRPEWAGADEFVHDEVPVRVVPCVSVLAVREALLDRASDRWLVVLTDRPEENLGAGVLSHLLWHRLRTPDPWEAVRHRFAATGIDPALTSSPAQRDLATGLLAAAHVDGWPPAPGGVLTEDHALGALARARLDLGDPDVDFTSLLTWTAAPASLGLVGDLRRLAGDTLTDAVLDWAAGRTGAAAGPLVHLLHSGEFVDAVPLGLVVGLLTSAEDSSGGDSVRVAREALVRLESRLGGTLPARAALRSWSLEASAVTVGALQDPFRRPMAERSLHRADELLSVLQASSLAGGSDLLPAGLSARLTVLATALRTAAADGAVRSGADPDGALVIPEALAAAEQAAAKVDGHRLAEGDARAHAFRAGVRLLRWLAMPTAIDTTAFQQLVERHRDVDAWVDSAINDVAPGVVDPDLGAGLAAVLALVRFRRDAHDLAFARALAAHTSDDPALESGAHRGVWHLEEVLPQCVLPIAHKTPVLLFILDGMSVGVSTEVVADVLSRPAASWVEGLLPGQTQRAAALAVLPTLTEVSRASMLCGELLVGGQEVEQRGYARLTAAHGLLGATLFHKKPLDSSRLGYAVADDVGAAIDDVVGRPLVSCVLNTIDDALDRSDPAGIDWTADAVKHLKPLLDRAARAGRVVILTADHGHVVERRQGNQRSYPVISSGRSRGASRPAGEGEILVAGRRVLEHGGRAVLAVDERLRYGPLKAGYHGGASPAEALVPVVVLVPGAIPDGVDLQLAPPQEPIWWSAALAPIGPTAGTRVPASSPARLRALHTPTLFDPVTEEPAASGQSGLDGHPLAEAVVASATLVAQREVAGRISTTDEQVRALLSMLLLAPGQRLPAAQAAIVLAVPPLALRGAILHIQRLLNVEGYPVLRVDADGSTVILDELLLREQFEVS